MEDFLDQVFLAGHWSEASRPSLIGSAANETVDDLRNVYERNDVNLQVNESHFMRESNMSASMVEDNMDHMVAKGPMDDRIHLNKLVDTGFKLDSLNASSAAGYMQFPANWPSQYNSVPLPAPTIGQERTNGYGLQSGSMDRDESILQDELGYIGSFPLDQDCVQKTHPLNFTDRHLGFFGAAGGIQAQSKVLLSEDTNSSTQYGNQVTLSQFQLPTPVAVSSQIASKPRVRARRGQATDPHSIAERLRREKIAERLKNLQELVPNSNKTDKASSLDEIIEYVKFLQHQVKILSMSRVGAAGAILPLVTDIQSEGSRNLLQAGGGAVPDSPHSPDDVAFEQEVVKLMESNITSAMQFLQSKGLCLMPIALAAAMSSGKLPSNSQNSDWVRTLLPVGANGNVSGLHAIDNEPKRETGEKNLTHGCNGALKQEVQTLTLK